jgi:hypothetical protein
MSPPPPVMIALMNVPIRSQAGPPAGVPAARHEITAMTPLQVSGRALGRNLSFANCTPSDLRGACKVAANDPVGAEVHAGLGLPPGTDDLRSSAGSSTWHSCFACASDTVARTGQPVAEPSVAYAHERIG